MNLSIELRLLSQTGTQLSAPDIKACMGYVEAWRVAMEAAREHAEARRSPVCAQLFNDAGKLLSLRYFHPAPARRGTVSPRPAGEAHAPL